MGTLTLGKLIADLEQTLSNRDAARVYFDFCNCFPTKIESSRGDYSHLAINWSGRGFGSPPTLSLFIQQLCECLGRIYQGYKGGDYQAGMSTPIWVDNHGEWSATTITGVEVVSPARVYLLTARRED